MITGVITTMATTTITVIGSRVRVRDMLVCVLEYGLDNSQDVLDLVLVCQEVTRE